MAIVIEEEKKKSSGSPFAAFGWIVIIGIIVVAGYYIFLSTPESVDATPPAGFSSLEPISHIAVMPQDVAGMSSFQALRAVPQATTGNATIGKSNPFLP